MAATKSQIVTIKRKTAESNITFRLDNGPRKKDYKKDIRTPLQFFNHMLETISWRACLNLAVDVKLDDFKLTHVICEDVGLCAGEAFGELFGRETAAGVNGQGAALSCIDEAVARALVSFEGRSLYVIDEKLLNARELVEDMQSADLVAFLEGFTQGGRATLHIDLLRGSNPHHVWEAVFRALGEALRIAFAPCPWRKGTTPGVKGNVVLEKE
jgi:imidazoleglycerol-phosphate dehydratase